MPIGGLVWTRGGCHELHFKIGGSQRCQRAEEPQQEQRCDLKDAPCAKLPTMRRPTPSRPRRTLYGLIVAGCVVGLVEIGLRLNGVGAAYQMGMIAQWKTNPNLVDRRTIGSREPHNFVLNTNADGLRSTAIRQRTADAYRVVLMGDSNVFGWGIEDDETLAAMTQASLRAKHPTIEIINGGQPGYSTAQMSWLFSEVIRAYEPDLTILFLSMHDHNRVLVSDAESWRGADGPTAWTRVFLARHSRIYEALRRRLYSSAGRAQAMPDDTQESARVPRVSDEERRTLLGEMRTEARQWGGEITLGLMPDVADLRHGSSGQMIPRMGQAWAESWVASGGQELVNLRTCCPDGGEALVFPFDHGHMNAKGNALAALALAEWIEASIP